MAASDAKKTATSGSCNNVIYNGKNQTLASGGKNVTYVNNKALDAGTYQVTAVSNEGYAFADGTTSNTLTCSVDKKEVPVTFSNTKIEYTGSEVSPIATAYGINGENIELVTTKASSIGNYMTIASMKGINNNYTLKNTVADYEIVEDEIEETEKKIKTTYTINYYLMNQDGKNYTLFESKTSDAKVGEKVKGELKEYKNYITPKEIEIEIIEGENTINYYYNRK